MLLDRERRFASRADTTLERADDPYALRRRAVLETVEELVHRRARERLLASGLDPPGEERVDRRGAAGARWNVIAEIGGRLLQETSRLRFVWLPSGPRHRPEEGKRVLQRQLQECLEETWPVAVPHEGAQCHADLLVRAIDQRLSRREEGETPLVAGA